MAVPGRYLRWDIPVDPDPVRFLPLGYLCPDRVPAEPHRPVPYPDPFKIGYFRPIGVYGRDLQAIFWNEPRPVHFLGGPGIVDPDSRNAFKVQDPTKGFLNTFALRLGILDGTNFGQTY